MHLPPGSTQLGLLTSWTGSEELSLAHNSNTNHICPVNQPLHQLHNRSVLSRGKYDDIFWSDDSLLGFSIGKLTVSDFIKKKDETVIKKDETVKSPRRRAHNRSSVLLSYLQAANETSVSSKTISQTQLSHPYSQYLTEQIFLKYLSSTIDEIQDMSFFCNYVVERRK
eukprot:GHVL01013227.1.p1 GENE.GHVL01013227.1~~GHVL01013227.1.p1  ORF type:complete len:168 (+),score=57.42 GHVL01013227.1:638-1141(+)